MVLLNSALFMTKTLDFIISFRLHVFYQAPCYNTGALSCIYTLSKRNGFISHYSGPRKVKQASSICCFALFLSSFLKYTYCMFEPRVRNCIQCLKSFQKIKQMLGVYRFVI